MKICQNNQQFNKYFKSRKQMSEKKKLHVEFGDMNEKNINMLRKINFNVFPVKYATPFYINVATKYNQLSKFCFYNDIIVGAFTVRVEDFKEKKYAYILTIGILEPYRKYGIGTLMMEQLEKEVTEKTDAVGIYLHMHVINEIGRKFYQKCGFTVTQRLQNYYTDLEQPHCFILEKPINRKANEGSNVEAKQGEKK